MQPDFPIGESGSGTSVFTGAGSENGQTLLGRFVIRRDLADGSLPRGFEVLLVEDLTNGNAEAVLKICPAVADDSALSGPSLEQVSSTLAAVRHPNIEDIREAGHFPDGRPFALSTPIAGTALSSLIAPDKRLGFAETAVILEQAAEALAAAHARHILHCDLRPSNILIEGGSGTVVLVNFGTAWPIDVRGESLSNLPAGSESIHYAAPELLVALGHRSPASDIYSLSALAYRLLTGRVPYTGQDRESMLRLIHGRSAASPRELRPGLAPEAALLIMAGLEFEPADRPRSVADMGGRLAGFLRPSPNDVAAVEASGSPARVRRLSTPPLDSRPRRISAAAAESRTPVSERAIAWVLILLLMAGSLLIPVGQFFWRGDGAAAAVNSAAERPSEPPVVNKLTYLLEPAGPGDLAIAIESEQPGVACVIAEHSSADGRPRYRILYVAAGGEQKPPRIGLTGERPQAVWVIWSPDRVAELGKIGTFASGDEVSDDEDRRRLRHFLERNRGLRVKVTTAADGRTTLEGSGGRIIHRIDLRQGAAE